MRLVQTLLLDCLYLNVAWVTDVFKSCLIQITWNVQKMSPALATYATHFFGTKRGYTLYSFGHSSQWRYVSRSKHKQLALGGPSVIHTLLNTRDPFHKQLMSSKLKSRDDSFLSNYDYNGSINLQFCTYHERIAAVAKCNLVEWNSSIT